MRWTKDYILGLAPDTPSVSAAHHQAISKKWMSLKRRDDVIWGEVQGSSPKPYQSIIDLSRPAFKCTCPSRKSPCKHTLGLGLLYAQNADYFESEEMPKWVKDSILLRHGVESEALIRDELDAEQMLERIEAKEKRLQKRIDKVSDGLHSLVQRIEELLRLGLGSIEDPYDYWDHVASRLVDAQAPNLARLVREIPNRASEPATILKELGRLYMTCLAWKNRESLSPEELADLKSFIGFNVSQEELAEQIGVNDEWVVLGAQREQDQHLNVLKQWLWGRESGQICVLLSYSVYQQAHPLILPIGRQYRGIACHYPGTDPQRAIFKGLEELKDQDKSVLNVLNPPLGSISLKELSRSFAESIATNPWCESRAYLVHDFQIHQRGRSWFGCSVEGELYPILSSDFRAWRFLALTGGAPSSCLVSWDGEELRIHSLLQEDRVLSLSRQKHPQQVISRTRH